MPEKNIAVVLSGKRNLRVVPHPLPPKPGSLEVQLKVNYCGICGTDIHLWEQGNIGPYLITGPLVVGHEISATVVELGDEVKNLKIGDHVVVEPAVPCERCNVCRIGRYNACNLCNRNAKGLPPVDGCLTRYINHRASYCYKISDDVPLEVAALAEPLAVAVWACQRGEIKFGQKVFISGSGTIGLLCLIVAKTLGAEKIVISDIKPEKLELARQLGADETLLIREGCDVVSEVRRLLDGFPIVTLECTGLATCITNSIEVTAHGGKVVLVGLGPERVAVPLATASLREVDLLGVCRFRNTFPLTVKILAKERVKLAKLISKIFNLVNALDAFEELARGESVKVLIKCD